MTLLRLAAAAAIALAAQGFSTTQAAASSCWSAVQGHIAWNYHGNTQWNPTNVARLCQGGWGTEPATCFNHVMHGGVHWGGGTKWKWENAIDLCEGSKHAKQTVHCFNGKMAMGWGWQKAIAYCDERAYKPQACWNGVQGKVAWDYHGNRQWQPANINRLCGGAAHMEPVACFEKVMHGGVHWGGGTQWKWQNAIDLCEGTHDAHKTVNCFQQKLAWSGNWQYAIRECSY